MTVGHVGALGLTEARDKARNFHAMAKDGIDPRELIRNKKEEKLEDSRLTFQSVSVEFINRYCKGKDDKGNGRLRTATLAEYERILNASEFKAWEKRSIRTIDRKTILQALDSVVDRGAPIMANRYSAVLSKLLNWSFERGYIHEIPPVPKPGKENQRDRILSNHEIAEVWNAAGKKEGLFGNIVKLLLLTGQRRGEVSGMCWNELHDLDKKTARWIIPATRSKNGIEHNVSLSPLAVQIIESLPRIAKSPYCFTTTGKTPTSGFTNMKERLDKLIADNRVEKKQEEAMPPWMLHDLRRTAASGMARLNVPPHIVEKILNHTGGEISGVAAVYNRHEYAGEKQNALNAWSSYVANQISGKKDNNVRYLNKSAQ
ncbi:MAG: site-specific integrase [Proteobacteria bacterium]|nr:site-specific integrase [Pseudomonadota bacterium]